VLFAFARYAMYTGYIYAMYFWHYTVDGPLVWSILGHNCSRNMPAVRGSPGCAVYVYPMLEYTLIAGRPPSDCVGVIGWR
jgi:hypothetical protein